MGIALGQLRLPAAHLLIGALMVALLALTSLFK